MNPNNSNKSDSTQSDLHISVLLQQSVDALNIIPEGVYIDATFGRGGHSKLILSKLNKKGTLLVIDQDPTAIQCAQELQQTLQSSDCPKLIIHHGSFVDLEKIVTEHKLIVINGILFDLGVSSPQLDNADRGFSFNKAGPLDMRMNNAHDSPYDTAQDLINSISEKALADILWQYGEEKYSRKIAKAIILARKEAKITTTLQLAEIIKVAHPKWPKHKHPATQSFLALRLFINQELEAVEASLQQSLKILTTAGRLVVISFHSLEDRIVKNFMNKLSKETYTAGMDALVKKLPITDQELKNKNIIVPAQLKIVQKALKAGIIEGDQNIRARSAVLRVAEKL